MTGIADSRDFWIIDGHYGRIGFRVSFSGHALRRFIERVRPDMAIGEAQAYLNRIDKRVVAMRYQRRRRNESWLLRIDHDPPFTLACEYRISSSTEHDHVMQVFRAVTCLNGHNAF
ncbi:MAG: hypothetical protein KGO96_10490 [Elusimicrobia bacterium]|nr:hypothetical protein [Elusimicrobiota bacterium]